MKRIRSKYVTTLLTDFGKVINYSVTFPIPEGAVNCLPVENTILHAELETAFTVHLPIEATLIKGKYYYCETSEDFDKLLKDIRAESKGLPVKEGTAA